MKKVLLFICVPFLLLGKTMSEFPKDHQNVLYGLLDQAESQLIAGKKKQNPVVYEFSEMILAGLRVEFSKPDVDVGEMTYFAIQMVHALLELPDFYYEINLEEECPEYDSDSLFSIYQTLTQLWSAAGKGEFSFTYSHPAPEVEPVYCSNDPAFIPFEEEKYLKHPKIDCSFRSVTDAEFPDKCYPEYRALAQTQKIKHYEKAALYHKEAQTILKGLPAFQGKEYAYFIVEAAIESAVAYHFPSNSIAVAVCILKNIGYRCVKNYFYIKKNYDHYISVLESACQHMEKSYKYHKWLEDHPLSLPKEEQRDDTMDYYNSLFEENLKNIRSKAY